MGKLVSLIIFLKKGIGADSKIKPIQSLLQMDKLRL